VTDVDAIRQVIPTRAEAAEPDRPARSLVPPGFDRGSGLYVWAALLLIFGLWVPETFLTIRTWRALSADQAVTAIVALAALVPLAGRQFDLSVAHMLGFSLIVVTWTQSEWGLNPLLAMGCSLVVGVFVGAVNGFVVTRLQVPSLIATLATSSVLQAAILWLSDGQNISSGISSTFRRWGTEQPLGVPVPVIVLVVLALLLWYLLEHTPAGRYLYAVGGNTEAAALAGVPTRRYIFWSLVASATIASLAGVVFAAKVGSASVTAGPPYLLPAVSAVFLGATQIRPGRVNVWGTLVALLLLATGVKGLQLVGVPFWVQDLFNGVVLIIAVSLAALRGRGAPLIRV
jgi:ribose transport system permease protein